MTNFYPTVSRWNIPSTIWSASTEDLARDGAQGNEGIVLWLGRRLDSEAHVMRLLLIRGQDVTRRPSFVRVGDRLINDVTDVAIDLGLTLIGQAHSHGPGAGNTLSPTDRRYGIAVPGFLSIVFPDFALRALAPADCGVYVCDERRVFQRLNGADITERVFLVNSRAIAPLIVGGA